MSLSLWQRIKRRFALMGGSYKHPDGTIELDFEVAAGIQTSDSEAVQNLKLQKYYAKQKAKKKMAGAVAVGIAAYLLADRLGVPVTDAGAIGVLTSFGLYQMTAD